MENIIIFVPTGEVRQVKFGEFYKDITNFMCEWVTKDEDSLDEYLIYTKTEVPIQVPKPKIKKWGWECGNKFETDNHYSEDEMFDIRVLQRYIHRK